MVEQQSGALVHLGSVRSRLPVPTQVVYASAKAAVASLSKSLALHL
jgi:short-subunit dehydrogenase